MKKPQTAGRSASGRNQPTPSQFTAAALPITSQWQGGTGTYASLHSQYRAIALQILYEHDTTDHVPSRIFHQRMYSLRREGIIITNTGQDFVRRLVFGILAHKDELDDRIGHVAQRYPIDTLLPIDRNILRMALYESEAREFHNPVAVTITEAIHLAEAYGSETSPNFIHGVLGAMLAHQDPAPGLI